MLLVFPNHLWCSVIFFFDIYCLQTTVLLDDKFIPCKGHSVMKKWKKKQHKNKLLKGFFSSFVYMAFDLFYYFHHFAHKSCHCFHFRSGITWSNRGVNSVSWKGGSSSGKVRLCVESVCVMFDNIVNICWYTVVPCAATCAEYCISKFVRGKWWFSHC